MEQITKRLFNWASIVDEEALNQARRASEMPFIFPHLALMPDAHLGKGATVGSVIPTENAIIPAAVGVDIGCGMIAVQTNVHVSALPEERTSIRQAIEWAIPLSAGRANNKIVATAEPKIQYLEDEAARIGLDPDKFLKNWREQLGTLGSGNHFIEVTADETGRVWLFLHSGSRGVGNKIATHHIKVAQMQMKKYFITIPDPDLAYLVDGTEEFDLYIRDLHWAQMYALLNREEMMDRVVRQFEEWMSTVSPGYSIRKDQVINCHHNYTAQERHFGRNVWLSRKGAIDASLGTLGLVPGSMGTASYVVEGKGNRLALNSSPHGAGRNFSRSSARRTFTMDQLTEAMQGIEWSGSKEFLDEIPQAYKDIDIVMRDAADLVEIKHTLHQLVNVKGS